MFCEFFFNIIYAKEKFMITTFLHDFWMNNIKKELGILNEDSVSLYNGFKDTLDILKAARKIVGIQESLHLDFHPFLKELIYDSLWVQIAHEYDHL